MTERTAPSPADGEVLVRVLEVGVCGTDREIVHGGFGIAPGDDDRLVLGHELLGVVERDAPGFAKGELVAATVRRSCGHCLACAESSPDSCLTGDYLERGITRLHGFAQELVAEDARELVPIPGTLGRLGVLAEPTSICTRALRHAQTIGGRQPWRLERALVLGAGAVGRLMTMLLRLHDVDVWTVSLEAHDELVEAVGAHYATSVDGLGRFDLVVEAAGDAQLMADSIGLLARGGVACLIGIDGREQRIDVAGRTLAFDFVLQNNVVFGTVNAQRRDWDAAVQALEAARRRWPDALEGFVKLRVPLDRFADAFAERGGKATLVLA
ncbi:MAG TPA: alcohol dehydrogenase catalytic domain-containing protein [Gaiellaceae bacterium]|nr:alcohol dehydrogenase catalytic domain-containing protein [Gaiellaceae bacterium]